MAPSKEKSEHAASLIQYAKSSLEDNPADALSALMEALELRSGKASADRAMDKFRRDLWDDVTDRVEEPSGMNGRKREVAIEALRRMLEDETTLLYAQGRQDLLRQAMEDGSSLVCSRCGGMVPSARWEEHQKYWCEAAETTGHIDDDGMEE